MLMLFIKFITSATLILFPNMSSIRFWSIPYSALSTENLGHSTSICSTLRIWSQYSQSGGLVPSNRYL